MPKIVDEQARRERIAEAVWAIVNRDGLHAATVRAVATECGLSTGSIQHSFPTQAALLKFAMELIVNRASERINGLAALPADEVDISRPTATVKGGAPLTVIADLLLQLLPLDQQREAEARVWAAFSTAALTQTELAPYARHMDCLLESFCSRCLQQLAPNVQPNHRALTEHAVQLHALLDGLTLHLLTNPSPDRNCQAVRVIEHFLQSQANELATL